MIDLVRAAAVLAAGSLLAGCASRGPLIEPSSRSIELADTPFFAQQTHQCGPAALATVLGASGLSVSPEELVPQVYVPARRGSLTIEMQAAPRRYGRIAYPLEPGLDSILAEVDAGRPVLVLHNYGLPFWPRWHYAVVIGYDAAHQDILLRSGTTRRQHLPAATFMRAWDNADRWALVLLRPGELPARPAKGVFLRETAAFERVATPENARTAYEAALSRWPDDPVAWTGRGTANYRLGRLRFAAADYAQAVALDPSQAGARNNLAMTLLELECPEAARRELAMINVQSLQGALRDAVDDTIRQVETRPSVADARHCTSPY